MFSLLDESILSQYGARQLSESLKVMVAIDDEAEILAARRRDLEVRLHEKGVLKDETSSQASSQTGAQEPNSQQSQMGQAVKLASEFLAAVVVGVLLGLGFDQITGFTPWGLVVFLFLGFASGVLNMLRSVGYVEPHHVRRQEHRPDDNF